MFRRQPAQPTAEFSQAALALRSAAQDAKSALSAMQAARIRGLASDDEVSVAQQKNDAAWASWEAAKKADMKAAGY